VVNQQDVLEAINQEQSPVVTTQEMSEAIDASKSATYRHLQALYGDGKIEKRSVGASAVVWWNSIVTADKPYIAGNSTVFEENVIVEIEGEEKDSVLEQTEIGHLNIHVDMEIGIVEDAPYWAELSGRTLQGENLDLENVSIRSFSTDYFVDGVCFAVFGGAAINGVEEVIIEQEQVQFSVDLNCFTLARRPQENWLSSDFRPVIERESVSINESEAINWSFSVAPLQNLRYRIDSIRNHQDPIRTMKGKFNIEGVYGPINRFSDMAVDRLDKIITLSRFFMGCKPNFSKIQLNLENEAYDESNSGRFIKFRHPSVNVGSAFKSSQRFFPGIMRRQIDSSYDKFLSLKKDYRLGYVLGSYVDAIEDARSIEGSFTNLCTAVEVLAERHAAKHQTSESATQDRITTLVSDLNVETNDLALHSDGYDTHLLDGDSSWHSSLHQEHNHLMTEYIYSAPSSIRASVGEVHRHKGDTIPDRLKGSSGRFRFSATHPPKEYFYQKSRNYLVHGDPQVDDKRLHRDKMLVEVLLRRILFNILYDEQHSEDVGFLLPPLEPTNDLLFFE
jgi:DNA-binding transcriptional ArsR family regulator